MASRTPASVFRTLLPALLALAPAVLTGCTFPRGESDALAVAPDRYALTFDTAREVLRDARFELDRVDARAGVITTHRKKTLGALTPWDAEQTSVHQELDDTLNRQWRTVRITFEPADGRHVDDLLAEPPQELVMRVSVVIEREQQPGWQLESTSIRLNSHTTDLALARRGMTPRYSVPVTQDPVLAASLAELISARVEEAEGGGR